MSLGRGRYGVEWVPRPDEPKSSGLKVLLIAVGVVALLSFSVTRIHRWRQSAQNETRPAPVDAVPRDPADASAHAPDPTPVVSSAVRNAAEDRRPARVRTLLLRLEEAEKRRDTEMAISTIEQIRSLPGSPAADLDDALARRLGVLNMRRLFSQRSPLWVRRVTLRRGQSLERLAAENGSTYGSLVRLNGGNVSNIKAGSPVLVMDHPGFTLVVHRRARTADLLLKDKFFKRYDLVREPKCAAGSYEQTGEASKFLKTRGLDFSSPDFTELGLLLPPGSRIIVSEM